LAENLTVAIGFRAEDDIIRAIEAVAPRIKVVTFPQIASLRPMESGVKEEILRGLAPVEVMLVQANTTREYYDAAPGLKWVQVIAAGVERMADDGLLKRGFQVTNIKGLSAPAIAEWVLGTMVMLEKGLHTSLRDQVEHRWGRHFVGELSGKTVGVVGMGAIGRETARRAQVFGMRVVATRRTAGPGASDPDCDELLSHAALDRLLEQSDYVVLSVPLTPETHHLIGEAQFKKMKPTAKIVNVARGPVIDQQALIKALKEGRIGGAALDVTDPEPLPPESELWDIPSVIITPHISGSIDNYVGRANEVFTDNLRRYLAGEQLRNLVDPELGY
jgi:phosphoglycerate dehydrogenase-like enzyme